MRIRYMEDLRNVACMSGFGVCDLAADDIEAMQLEIADHEKAYRLLFKENAKKDKEIAALREVCKQAFDALYLHCSFSTRDKPEAMDKGIAALAALEVQIRKHND